MKNKPYRRAELEKLGDKFPDRGKYCPKCQTYIPQFEDMDHELETRCKKLIRDNKRLMSMAELMAATGCSERWAKIWVIHAGEPTPEYPGPPCPKCGKPTRTSLAKQCPHCFYNWRDTQ